MQIRHIGGIIESRYPAGAAFERGNVVKLNGSQQVIAAGDNELGMGIAAQSARVISQSQYLGYDIMNSSYDEGLPSFYSGRRHSLKVTYANVGEAVGVLQGAANVIEDIVHYEGTPALGDLLTSNVSGWLKTTANHDIAIARCQKAPDAAYPNSTIDIVTL